MTEQAQAVFEYIFGTSCEGNMCERYKKIIEESLNEMRNGV